MWRFFVPLKYLQISHPEKAKFNLVFPLIFAVLVALPLLSEKFRHDAVAGLDILGRSSDLLSILTGFFIAALAAVSTFGGQDMDLPMSGDDPVILRHPTHAETLTRRRFLSFLFGYLALVSLFIYLSGFAFYALQTYWIKPSFPDLAQLAFILFWICYGFLLGNLLSNTLLGLFYLTDRIHRPNRDLKRGTEKPL